MITNIFALVLYTAIMIVSMVTVTIYYLSNKTLPNYMIKATMLLLLGVTLNAFATWIFRLMLIFNLPQFHALGNVIVLTIRCALLLILINFLKYSVKPGKLH